MSYKLDGIRAAICEQQVRSKSLKLIPNKHVQSVLSRPELEDFDGELIVGPPNSQTTYNTTFSGVMSIDAKADFKFYVFDLIDAEENALNRKIALYNRVAALPADLRSYVVLVTYELVNAWEEVEQRFDEALRAGYEGLIAIRATSLYKCGRSTPKEGPQYKLKPEDDKDCEILSAHQAMHNANEAFQNELGETDRSTHAENKIPLDRIGYFMARDVESGEKFRLAPGKLTHDELTRLWHTYQADGTLPSRFAKYRSMGYGVKDKPRHPRFYAWRGAADV